MSSISRQNKWAFGLGWIVVNGLGWGLFYLIDILVRFGGGLTSSAFMFKIFQLRQLDLFTASWIGALTCGLIWGAFVGFLQRLTLRRRLVKKGNGWIAATMIGLIPLGVYLYLYQILTSTAGVPADTLARLNTLFSVVEVTAPFWLGLAQWLVFRQTCRRSGWWIVAAAGVTALLTFSFPSSFLTLQVFRPHHAFLLLAPGGLGVLYALTTWFALTLLPPK